MRTSRRQRAKSDDDSESIAIQSRREQATTPHGQRRSLHSLQQSLGNQAIQELHRRDELETYLAGDSQVEPVDHEQTKSRTEWPQATAELAPDPSTGIGGGIDVSRDQSGGIDTGVDAESGPGGSQPGENQVVDTEPSSALPDEDPAFNRVLQEIESAAAQERSHPMPAAASAAAQLAAESPPNEVPSKAAAMQVEEMADQQPQPFDRAVLKATLVRRLEATAPKTLEAADAFADGDELAAVKSDVIGAVEAEANSVQEPIAAKTTETPDTSAVSPKPTTPLQTPDVGSAPPDIDVTGATPKPKSESVVSTPFEERSRTLDQQLDAVDLTEEHLETANEPMFTAALEAKREAQCHARDAPAAYRDHEQHVLSQAETEAADEAQSELQSMHETRSLALDRVGDRQKQTKNEDERKRAEVAADIQAIYEETTNHVTDRLDSLNEEVLSTFDQGAETATEIFESYVDERMRAYKAERYSGPGGWARWGKDKLLGLPNTVEQFYIEGRRRYLAEMDATIDRVIETLEIGLVDAQELIADGRQTIADYVARLPASLQMVGQAAANDIATRFTELEQRVHGTKDQLIDSLTERYIANEQALDTRIEELQAENRGLVDTALDAVGGVVRTILQLKSLLLGVLGKATSAVGTIIRDPIGVLGNLVSGVTQGLERFVSNIWTHLQTGLVDWLTGAVAEAGVQLPDQFDLAGIFSLVTQVLGLTYANIRTQAVSVLGEETVSALEETFVIFETLVSEGIAGLWSYVQAKIGDLKSMVLDKIRELVITEVIEAGVKWLIGLLGPVGAFIKACMAIFDTVSFFVQRARDVVGLVEAVLDSVLAIAQGNLGAVASYVENALAGSVSILIGFLASLLGVSGLPKKVHAVIETIQQPINRGIQWVIEQAKVAVKRLGGSLGMRKRDEDTEESSASVPEGGTALTEAERDRLYADVRAAVDDRPAVEDRDELQKVLTSIAADFAGRGLRGLSLADHESSAPWKFTVLAHASAGKDVGETSVNMTIDVSDIYDFRYTTVLRAWINDGPVRVFKNEKFDPNEHPEHAETWMLTWLLSNPPELLRRNEENVVHMEITRSPCPDCFARLRRRQKQLEELGYPIRYDIRVASVYYHNVQKGVKDFVDMTMLEDEGLTLSPWDILAEIDTLGLSEEEKKQALTHPDAEKLRKRVEKVRLLLDAIDELRVMYPPSE